MPQGPTDFDALLAALGAADAEPPPLMKQLLAGIGEPGRSQDSDERALVELETWLAALHAERLSRFPSQ